MVELLDPEPGERIIDPAAGTGGFLFSAQQYLLRKFTKPASLRIEWDGTPHRASGDRASKQQRAAIDQGKNFVGLDNDRTMARIGWMNLVLHDLRDPHLVQGDSLSKREGRSLLTTLLKPESYHVVLANPPFTGTVDSSDMERDPVLFPRAAERGKRSDEVITNKSELLFCWLALDLLKVGGRCAIIVPEGVLFGNNDAHLRLRRELLTEHLVEAVISLPGGLFQPYSAVKTSILIFRKHTRRSKKRGFTDDQPPLTQEVWFYEIETDGRALDAKRSPHPTGANDLWDALEKFRIRQRGAAVPDKDYFQPAFEPERWRTVVLHDEDGGLTAFGEAFGRIRGMKSLDGQVRAIHELFRELPSDPASAERGVRDEQGRRLREVIRRYLDDATSPLFAQRITQESTTADTVLTERTKVLNRAHEQFSKACEEAHRFFEPEDSPALAQWRVIVKDAIEAGLADYEQIGQASTTQFTPREPLDDLRAAVSSVAREVAKLDGFDVMLRSTAVKPQPEPLSAAKHWVVPVRAYARNDGWRSADGALHGSHDTAGAPRDEYIEWLNAEGLYDETDRLKDGLLDPDCVEARDWNLCAGQYKPFDVTELRSDKSLSKLIAELRESELEIVAGIDRLLAMVEERE